MYDHLLRAQKRSILEWLVVNALIPSVLITFAHHVWQMQHAARTRVPRISCYTGFLFPPDGFHPREALPEVFPVLIRMPNPAYPKEFQRAGIQERVILRAIVDEHGRVDTSSVLVVQATERQFVLAARKALSQALFRPGRIAGKPTVAWAVIAIEFTLGWEATYENVQLGALIYRARRHCCCGASWYERAGAVGSVSSED